MRVILCDDHQLLLETLSQALTHHGVEVVAATALPAGLPALAGEHQPDVCLLDLGFPEGHGLDSIGPIHAASPGTKVVVLSGTTDAQAVQAAIANGVDGFIGKDRPIEEVLQTLEKAVDGQLAIDPPLLRRSLRTGHDQTEALAGLQYLTRREWEVSRCIVEGLSTDEIAAQLNIRRSTARTHVQNLLSKLGVHTRLQAAALLSTSTALDQLTQILGGR